MFSVKKKSAYHLEGLGDPHGKHADTEEDEERGPEADSRDHANTEGLSSLKLTKVIEKKLSFLNRCFDILSHLSSCGSGCKHFVGASFLRLVGACSVIIMRCANISRMFVLTMKESFAQ